MVIIRREDSLKKCEKVLFIDKIRNHVQANRRSIGCKFIKGILRVVFLNMSFLILENYERHRYGETGNPDIGEYYDIDSVKEFKLLFNQRTL